MRRVYYLFVAFHPSRIVKYSTAQAHPASAVLKASGAVDTHFRSIIISVRDPWHGCRSGIAMLPVYSYGGGTYQSAAFPDAR